MPHHDDRQSDQQDRASQLAQLASQMRQLINDDGTITVSGAAMNLLSPEGAGGLEQDYLQALSQTNPDAEPNFLARRHHD